ncbi:DUF2437 domain-containing protein [Metallosphaera hakonensis JCM 8857 = DSM 7519]|uniref:2-hydroxyhepta-2,4-diene-1,7-dioate isomerase n=2 Tax=Metallosphaera hakonensis TaxID=79601 RepID=A0A2U9IV31_9CREN|nr:fumarylacetoacetate hydrolase family protein [Metallosphaera hakonensis]AWR99926.1 DUF2437 domain-containing protein [Metallosphaera hakonensis JCM 8857 = DSM 7519]
MRLVSFLHDGERRYGYIEGDEVKVTEGLGGRETGEEVKLSQVKLSSPFEPTAIFCTLVNSPRMLGVEGREEAKAMLGSPKFFLKLPQIVIGPGDAIVAPESGVRPEVEIGIVIAKPLKMATRDEVRKSILGYTVFNDVTAPGEMKEDIYYAYRRDPLDGKIKKMAVRGTHFRNKNRDTFAPMGPWIVTTEELSDVSGLIMRSIYGDSLVQEGSSDELVYGVEDLVMEVSRVVTVPKFSLITTGTIGYKGAEEASEYRFHSTEAKMIVEVEKIGRLENIIKPEQRQGNNLVYQK